jgi:lipopolysaccharide transport system ATP-binding protein
LKPILEIRGISKKYIIQGQVKPYLSLRESLFSFLRPSSKKEEFWALRDVDLDVMPGDTIGLIGKNGAGKSTLLKILSKITPPTSGRIISRGRIASLLEVGTGFHAELTGRENIYLNGSILGMKRKEIERQFDAIIDFSGVEKFVDTPLKHYSSGMQLRLAFAVAAFLEPEILIIDEVLAVGDAEFQKKCLGKMEDVSRHGRTVIFVSHNMGAISQLCKKGVVLQKGQVVSAGTAQESINIYLKPNDQNTSSNSYTNRNTENKKLVFLSIETCHRSGVVNDTFGFDEPITVKMKIAKNDLINSDTKISVTLLDKFQARIFTVVKNLSEFGPGDNSVDVSLELPASLIAPNIYSFRYAIFSDKGEVFDLLEDITKIKIVDTGSPMAYYEGVDYGSVIVNCNWK